MTFPKKNPVLPAHQQIANNLPMGMQDRLKDKTMEEILVELADMKKIDIAGGLVQGAINADPSSLKVLQAILEKQGGGLDREIPLTDEQFKTLIRIAARDLI